MRFGVCYQSGGKFPLESSGTHQQLNKFLRGRTAMSLSRRHMMYGLVGLAGMTRNITNLHAHHHHNHAPRFGKQAVQAALEASGDVASKAPGVSGQGAMKFKVLYA